MYRVNKQGQLYPESVSPCDLQDDTSCDINDEITEGVDIETSSCKRATKYKTSVKATPVTSTSLKSQIVIVSSQEMPPSSVKSETIDVGTEDFQRNPFSEMNINDIPIEIVDDLNDVSDVDVMVTTVEAPPVCIFSPLNDEECVIAALKFSLVVNPKSHPVKHVGVGKVMSHPPTVTILAKPNGACLFNLFSMLLTGQDTYSAIIRHIVCNYIGNLVKYKILQPYIPDAFKTRKEYVAARNMHTFSTWGTEVKVVAFTQLSGFDVKIFTPQKQWALYCDDGITGESSTRCFYLSNESGFHFDPIFKN